VAESRAPSILVLVLSARTPPYPALVRTIERTWASVRVEGVEVVFYAGGSSLRLRGRDLTLPVPDDLEHAGAKTLAGLAWSLRASAPDLVFRTNCSTYVDLPNLAAFLQRSGSPRGFYGGEVGVHEGVAFASGAGYVLSRDLVELVLERQDEWDHSLLDDVALGALLAAHGVSPRRLPRQDLTTPGDVSRLDLSQFHVRCKSADPTRRDDAAIMLAVHRAFSRARGDRPGARRTALPYAVLRGRALAARAVRRLRRPGGRAGTRPRGPRRAR
jgi:hypothetical protein